MPTVSRQYKVDMWNIAMLETSGGRSHDIFVGHEIYAVGERLVWSELAFETGRGNERCMKNTKSENGSEGCTYLSKYTTQLKEKGTNEKLALGILGDNEITRKRDGI